MGSSFLTAVNVALSLYCFIAFLKTIIQFGLPNHPARFILYLVSFCVVTYFFLKAGTGLGQISPEDYLRWRTFPLVAGSLGLLLQVITTVGHFSNIQQKIISRVPIIGAMMVFAFFPGKGDLFFTVCILATVLFLSVSVGKVRYQKRTLLKMVLFIFLSYTATLANQYWIYVLGEAIIFLALFYFFIFQSTYGVSALIDRHLAET